MGRDGSKVSGEGIRQEIEQTSAETDKGQGLVRGLADTASQVRVVKGIRAQGQPPGRGQDQDEQQAVGLSGVKMRAECQCQPSAWRSRKEAYSQERQGIQVAVSTGRWRGIRDQQPGLGIANFPNDVNGQVEPAGFLEDCALCAPVLTGGIAQMLQGAFLTLEQDPRLALHAEQDLQAQGLRRPDQLRRRANAAVGLDEWHPPGGQHFPTQQFADEADLAALWKRVRRISPVHQRNATAPTGQRDHHYA